MSVTTHIIGFYPPDDEWQKMKQVYDAIIAAGLDIPEVVDDFFDGMAPDDAGVEVDLGKTDCISNWRDIDRKGFVLDIAKLPKNITQIRFYQAW